MTPLAALCGALFVIFALVAPVLAVQGPTKLYDPSVSPRAGSPTTTITFEVGYRNREGSPPDHVSVVIDGVAHAMRGDGGTNWKAGLRNHFSTKLRAGTHTVSFEAMSRDKFSDTIDGGTVTITIPPTPKPTPTPAPTAGSTGAGGTGSGGTGDGGSGAGAIGPDGGSAGSGTDGTGSGGAGGAGYPGYAGSYGYVDGSATVGDSATDGPATGSTDGGRDGSDPASNAIGANGFGAAGTTGGPGRSGPDSTSGGPAGADPNGNHLVVTGGAGWGALATALQALGIQRPPTITMLPMLVGTSGAMTLAFAFAIFGKKRRDEEPPAPDEVLRANAARGHGGVPGSEVVNGVVRVAALPGPVDTEAGMPRWRRPSLLEARKADPTRFVAASHRMSFDNGVVAAADGRERRVIRYAVVRLLDAPDELRSTEIGQLDQGDEVQLIERSGSYWLVLCPDGRQGWLHRMTLGEIVSDASAGPFGRDIDDDVLTAFLTARARA